MKALLLLLTTALLPSAAANPGDPDVNRKTPPDTSLADFSYLVEAPAGRRGFVATRPDGHFYFEDGTRARFWGVNLSGPGIRQPDEVIEATVRRFRRAGVNMLRLEAPDNVGNLLDTPVANSSRNINAAYLNRMHKWMAECRDNGIYVYFQLLDFRTFKEGDGVPNAGALGRAAKPYAFFNLKLIELQKEYARQVLLTPNPYTGLKPVKDPSVALVELANEHGLFIKGSSWRSLAPPYDAELRGLWNDWLKRRYGTTAALNKGWTSPEGRRALTDVETLEAGTVQLPDMSGATPSERRAADWSDPATSPVRRDDGARFAYDVQVAFFREMKTYLQGLGVRVPVTCSVSTWIAPDVKSVADSLDFTSENAYWDHPAFEPGKEWQKPFYYANQDPTKATGPWTFPPYTAALKWSGKPVVIREWSAVWPNRYRAAYAPIAAAYACRLDLDGMLAFTYTFRDSKLSDFAWERDPARWGLMGLAAAMFHRRDIRPSADTARVSWTDKALFTWQDTLTDLNRLAWVAGFENAPAGSPAGAGVSVTVEGGAAAPAEALAEALGKLTSKGRVMDPALKRVGVMRGLELIGLDTGLGVFSAISRKSVVFAGSLSALPRELFPSFRTPTPFGVFWATTLDERPLAETDRYLFKMVSSARNTGEEFALSEGKYYADRFALKSTGSPPILTDGEPSATATRYAHLTDPGHAQLMTVGMKNGTWEVMRLADRGYVYCDTPGISFRIPEAVVAVASLRDGTTRLLQVREGAFVYPEDCQRVELRYVARTAAPAP